MPSHADRVRRQYSEAPPPTEPALTVPREPKQLLSELERYAGWLAKDHVSVAVRADVRALAAALDVGDDTSLLLLTLDKDIGRLPGGSVRKMLRRAFEEIRTVLGRSEIDANVGEGL
jgi:hypothetical protein